MEVAITVLDSPDLNMTDPYKVTFTIWRMDMTSLEILWSAQTALSVIPQNLGGLVSGRSLIYVQRKESYDSPLLRLDSTSAIISLVFAGKLS